MWSVSQIAERDGVSKQAVSKKARALAAKHGLTVELSPQGRIARLNVAEYDHLRGRFGDPSKAQAPRSRSTAPMFDQPASEGPNESYDEALRQKTWHEAEKRRLELAEIKGELIRTDKVAEALARCGEDIARIIDRLPNAADDLSVAVAREGSHGLRVGLKNLAHRMRGEISAAMASLGREGAGEAAANESKETA